MSRLRAPLPVIGIFAALVLGGSPARALESAPWPPSLAAQWQRSGLPANALAIEVRDLGSDRVVLSHNPRQPMNPASLAKLVTTYAALDRLGPAWTWRTPVWLAGVVRGGQLHGDLVLRGSGDPSLVIERLWLALGRVQQAGVRHIEGDIVLDRSAFAVPPGDPGSFDGEPLRPYNVLPDALLLNHKAVTWTITPDPASGKALVRASPPLADTRWPDTVALGSGACADWRAGLKLQPSERGHALAMAGSYPASCGERSWPMADPWPATYNARLVLGLWQAMGGTLAGRVREGQAPETVEPSFEIESPPLALVVRDINKYSNNTMARQLALTLTRAERPDQPADEAAAREGLLRWMAVIGVPQDPPPLLDNGAGLSRHTRLTAAHLAALLRHAWASPVMPELMASLPVAGTDGTLRKGLAGVGRAHLKTGSLRDTYGLAGYVLGPQGRRYLLVAMANHERAAAARPLFDALTQWLVDGGATEAPR